jgi:hypothetical protein
MSAAELPGWLRYRKGKRPIILVAPHGGERVREIRRGDGMNDLFTAELTNELASRLDAYAVVNQGLDRNEVDLNRISAVVERAPEMLRVLRDAVNRAGAGSPTTPLVLFVHGWNISSLACDIGIGLRESGGELYGMHPTVSWGTVQKFVGPLRDALSDQGLQGFVGHRYSASGRDNATQLFSGRHLGHDHDDVDHFARLALDGRVDAVQLELSIPLRWPGAYRARWLTAVEAAIEEYLAASQCGASDGRAIRKWAPLGAAARVAATQGGRISPGARGESVQAVLADGSGLFMGVEPAGPGALAARVCLARRGGELALFVCEAPWSGSSERFATGGLDWQPGRRVRYDGPAVLYDTHDAFVDLEGGLRSAQIVDVELEIPLSGDVKTAAGTVGYVCLDGKMVEVSPLLVRRPGGRLAGEHGVRARVTVLGPDGVPVSIEEAREPRAGPGTGGDVPMPGRIVFADNGARVRAQADAFGTEIEAVVTVRVPVYRPAPDGGVVQVVFGVAEIVGGGGFGPRVLFEEVRRLHASP